MKPIKIGTDCAGIEAPIDALKQLGIPYIHVFSCEIDDKARVVINANSKPVHIYTNITERDHKKLSPIDLYVCGFPCQPFTVMNHTNPLAQHKSHNIFHHVLQVIKHKQPKFFILENVKGLTTGKNKEYFLHILNKLNQLGKYDIHHSILNTADYGIPQSRPRLYIVGVPKNFPFHFPQKSKRKSTFHSYLEKNHVDHFELPPHKLKECMPFNNHIIDLKFLLDSSPTFKGSSGNSRFKNTDTPCFLESSRGYYLTKQKRLLSAREMLNLHGFSKKFKIPPAISDRRMRRFAGNTMSVNVLKKILQNLYKI